jgi:hypothetical protein
MVFFANLGVNLRGSLCGVPKHASAQPLDFLDIDKKSAFLNWKLYNAHINDGHYLNHLMFGGGLQAFLFLLHGIFPFMGR